MFKKIGPDQYKSSAGRIWTKKQVEDYYASQGITKK